MKKELVCINCPVGCRLTVTEENGVVTVEGNTCKRGEVYGRDEITDPKRVVTALVAVIGRDAPLPVKTASPIKKDRIFDVAAELKRTTVTHLPVKIGDVIIENVCGTGVNIVATDNT